MCWSARSGLWALRFLIAALAITPLRRLGGPNLIRYRRAIGLLAFIYATLHLTVYMVLDQGLDVSAIIADIIKRPYITVGMFAFLILVPLAVTSNNAMIRRLGGGAWQKLHRWVYVAAAAAAIHFIMLVKAWPPEPLIYAALVAILLLFRLGVYLQKRQKPRTTCAPHRGPSISASPRPTKRPSLRLRLQIPPIRVAARRIERQTEMLAQRVDRLGEIGIRILIAVSHDDWPERARCFALRRQHRRHQSLPFAIAQGQEQRHCALDMRLSPDALLHIHAGPRWHVGLGRLFMRLPEVSLHGVVHGLGLERRFGDRFKSEPRQRRGVAHILHHPRSLKVGSVYTTQAPSPRAAKTAPSIWRQTQAICNTGRAAARTARRRDVASKSAIARCYCSLAM